MKPVLALTSALFFTVSAVAADPAAAINETRALLRQWTETRQTLAKTKADWQVERQILEQSIQLHEAELRLLDKQTEQAEQQSSAADKARVALQDEQKRLEAAANAVGAAIDQFEDRVVKQMKAFPEPLLRTIAPLARRIPDADKRKKLSLSERMQNVVGILSEVDKFNNTISVSKETRKAADGTEYSVDTLYLGLSQAFFVSQNGQRAGVGYPAEGVWQWADKPELAPRIRQALDMHNNLKPAAFVGLEVQVR